MNISLLLSSVLTGSTIGFLYGLFFLFEKRRVLSHSPDTFSRAAYLRIVFGPLTRIAFFAGALYVVLRFTSIHFILVVVSFLTTFWLVIFNKKAVDDGRS